MPIRDRIQCFRCVKASELRPNPANRRSHSERFHPLPAGQPGEI